MSFRQFENNKFFQCKITLERSLFYWLERFWTCPFHYRLIWLIFFVFLSTPVGPLWLPREKLFQDLFDATLSILSNQSKKFKTKLRDFFF
jgi:hypothetical protein